MKNKMNRRDQNRNRNEPVHLKHVGIGTQSEPKFQKIVKP